MGSRSELFVEASASADLSFHVQRVAAKFAPSTLQRYFDSWLNWVSFCRLSGADPLSPPPGLLPDWLRSQSSKKPLVFLLCDTLFSRPSARPFRFLP